MLFVALGLWQLRRLDERRADNALIEERALVARAAGGRAGRPRRRRRVSTSSGSGPSPLTGTYREGADVAVRATQDGPQWRPGLLVARPPDGESVVVLRGFVPVQETARSTVPPPPAGEVEVEGLAIPIERLESVFRQARRRPRPRRGQPAGGDPGRRRPTAPTLAVVPPPDLGEGPHFGYAVQWFLFAAVGPVGYPLLLRRRGGEADHGA